MKKHQHVCGYVSPDGWKCDQSAEESGLCYWHDPKVDKRNDDLKIKVEEWVRSGRPLDGFQLARTNLKEIDLVNHGSHSGFKCRNADFYHANLEEANLFGLDLRGSSLMKSRLVDANLHCAKVEGANLLGADFTRARLESVNWGNYLKQEKKAFECLKQKNRIEANLLFQESEEVYRYIHKQCEKQGLYEQAGDFF